MNRTKNKKIIIYALCGALLLSASLTAVFLLKPFESTGQVSNVPAFVFSEEDAPGWWAGNNHNERASVSDEEINPRPIETLSTASIVAFKGEKNVVETACFAMFTYYDYRVDLAELKAEKDAGALQEELKMTGVGETQVTMAVFGKEATLTLNNYEISGPGSENSMKGTSFGWIEAGEGYVQVNGVCPTASELSLVADVVPAIALND